MRLGWMENRLRRNSETQFLLLGVAFTPVNLPEITLSLHNQIQSLLSAGTAKVFLIFPGIATFATAKIMAAISIHSTPTPP